MLLAAEPLAAVLEPVVPRGGRFSSGGNWKDTGTRPPSIPNPRGREEAEPSRLLLPAVETCVVEKAENCFAKVLDILSGNIATFFQALSHLCDFYTSPKSQ